jgi:hypothetical protein
VYSPAGIADEYRSITRCSGRLPVTLGSLHSIRGGHVCGSTSTTERLYVAARIASTSSATHRVGVGIPDLQDVARDLEKTCVAVVQTAV